MDYFKLYLRKKAHHVANQLMILRLGRDCPDYPSFDVWLEEHKAQMQADAAEQ